MVVNILRDFQRLKSLSDYIWLALYKVGYIEWPDDFDPTKKNLSKYAAKKLKDAPVLDTDEET